jgi:hypothetical protein
MAGNNFSIRRAIGGAALLIFPALAWPQVKVDPFAYHNWTNGHLTVKPHCVYKGVMSDADIELCTGHPVHYDYGVRLESPARQGSTRATTSG